LLIFAENTVLGPREILIIGRGSLLRAVG